MALRLDETELCEALEQLRADGYYCEPQATVLGLLRSRDEQIASLRTSLAAAEAERDRYRAALEEIARPGVGPEMTDTDEERADYWAAACERERETARKALGGG